MIARLNHRVKRLEDEYDAHWAFKVRFAFFYTHPRRLDIALGIPRVCSRAGILRLR